MVRKEITPIYEKVDEKYGYVCEICGTKYTDEKAAVVCESRGVDENTKIPIGSIVKYTYDIDNGDRATTFEERIGIVFEHASDKHIYYMNMLDLYDLRHYVSKKEHLTLLSPEESEKEFQDAVKDRMEELDLLRKILKNEIDAKGVYEYGTKCSKYYRRD